MIKQLTALWYFPCLKGKGCKQLGKGRHSRAARSSSQLEYKRGERTHYAGKGVMMHASKTRTLALLRRTKKESRKLLHTAAAVSAVHYCFDGFVLSCKPHPCLLVHPCSQLDNSGLQSFTKVARFFCIVSLQICTIFQQNFCFCTTINLSKFSVMFHTNYNSISFILDFLNFFFLIMLNV